jgi:hypothetical protein
MRLVRQTVTFIVPRIDGLNGGSAWRKKRLNVPAKG